MIPYGSFTFFFILVVLLAPTVILGLKGKKFHTYNMIVSVMVLAIIFSSKPSTVIALILFTVWQVLLIEGYIAYRKKANSGWIFSFAVIASILPLTVYKLLPYFSDTN